MRKKALVFITDGRRFLALRNNPDEPEKHGGDFWFTVTGGVEDGESYEDAVKREIKEETNLDVKEIINMNWGCMYKHLGVENEEHYYLVFVSPGKIKLSVEHIAYEWLSFEQFLNKIAWKGNKKELKRILKDALDRNVNTWKIIDDFINHKRIIYIQERKYVITWYMVDDFSKLPKDKVKGVYCVPFDSAGRILIVDVHRKNSWAIPGGEVEGNEEYFETLRRECLEEADMEIKDMNPLGYIEVIETDEAGNESKIYRIRYFARIKKLNKQTVDIATGVIPFRKLVKPKDFLYYCPWGFQGDEMIEKATKMFEEDFYINKPFLKL